LDATIRFEKWSIFNFYYKPQIFIANIPGISKPCKSTGQSGTYTYNPTLRRVRQEDLSSRPAWGTQPRLWAFFETLSQKKKKISKS
jgi:hypothetical protein